MVASRGERSRETPIKEIDVPELKYETILAQESKMLQRASKDLADFHREVEAEKDEVGRTVYASLYSAYQKAQQALQMYQTMVQTTQQATAQGRVAMEVLPPNVRGNFPTQGLDPAALNSIILGLRMCAERPTDVWRNEIRRQASELVKKLHMALMSGKDPRIIEKMCQLYTSAFCWFEAAWCDTSEAEASPGSASSWRKMLFSWQGGLGVLAVGTAGYFGGSFVAGKVKDYRERKALGSSQGDVDEEDEEEEETTTSLTIAPDVDNSLSPVTVPREV